MHIQYWDKYRIKNLSLQEKEDWFDVYNNRLEDVTDLKNMNQIEVNTVKGNIKKDYFLYLDSLIEDSNFMNYVILYDSDKIVSLCRLIKREGIVYIAGLETHRDYRRMGYGRKVVLETITYLFNKDYDSIHSVVRKWNDSSISTHKSVGFNITEDKGDSLVLSIGNIKSLVKEIIEDFIGRDLDSVKLLSEKIVLFDNQYNFDISFNKKRYVAKFHSNKDNKLKKLLSDIKINSNHYYNSKTYGHTHKFHLYGKEYWLWIETYK